MILGETGPEARPSVKHESLHAAAIVGVTFLYWAVTSGEKLVVPLYSISLGADVWLVGLIVGAASFLPLFLAVPVGLISDVLGHRRTIIIGAVCMALSSAVFCLGRGIWGLFIAQPLIGVSELMVWAPVQVVMTEGADRTARERRVSSASAAISLGQLAGPVAGGFIGDQLGYTAVFAVCVVASAFLLVSAIFLRRDVRGSSRPNMTFRGIIEVAGDVLKSRLVLLALLHTFLLIFTQSVATSFLPVLLTVKFGYSPVVVGLSASVRAFASLAIRTFMPRLTARFGLINTLNAASLLSLVSMMAAPLYGAYLPTLWIGSLVCGIGGGLQMPLAILLIGNNCSQSLLGVAMGLRLTMNRLGQLVGPLMFGFISGSLGLPASFYISGLALLLLLGGSVIRERKEADAMAG
jgi:MFS family permease